VAIDSRAKRASAAGSGVPFMLGVTLDATKGVAWRQAAGWSYSGIAPDGAGSTAGTRRQRQIKSLTRARRRRR